MKRYLFILCLAASYSSTNALADDVTPPSAAHVRESLEQNIPDPSLAPSEQAAQDKQDRQDRQDEKPQKIVVDKTRNSPSVPYVNGGYFGSTE